jgi:histidinol-phosphate aminotransferase
MAATKVQDLIPERIREMQAYTPGLQPGEGGWVKLNTNENPYPPSPRVEHAVIRAAGDDLRLYPEPRSIALRRAIAERHGVKENQVILGNGSDETLGLLARVFSGPDLPLGYLEPSYSLYPVLAAMQGAPAKVIRYRESIELDPAAIAASGARIFFLTTPNAPTGVGYSTSAIEEVLKVFDGILVADEAYADFADENAISLLARYPRLVVTRTFSKSYGLAGLRVGYAVGSVEIIEALDRIRDSYNLNRLSQAGALAAFTDRGYFEAIVAKVKRVRDFHRHALLDRGWSVYPSQTNFLFAEPRNRAGQTGVEVATEFYEFLKERKILVRRFPNDRLTCNFLRITVGDEEGMNAFQEGIDSWLANG